MRSLPRHMDRLDAMAYSSADEDYQNQRPLRGSRETSRLRSGGHRRLAEKNPTHSGGRSAHHVIKMLFTRLQVTAGLLFSVGLVTPSFLTRQAVSRKSHVMVM